MSTKRLRFLFLSLICLLSFSCSFNPLDGGSLDFNLPESREVLSAVDDVITYRITIQDMNGRIFYDKISTISQISINNLSSGRYYIVIKGHDSLYNYFGDKYITIKTGRNIELNIKLTKTKIDSGSGYIDSGSGSNPDNGSGSKPDSGTNTKPNNGSNQGSGGGTTQPDIPADAVTGFQQ